MKKSLLALAVLGAFAGAASAQSSVTIYGSIDQGLTKGNGGTSTSAGSLWFQTANGFTAASNNGSYQGNGDNGTSKAYVLKQSTPSRLGFRGNEDIGGGLSAQFQIEHRFLPDTGTTSSTFWGGRSYVQLSSATLGRVYLGREYTPAFWLSVKSDPFGQVGVAQLGAAAQLAGFQAQQTVVGNAAASVRTANSIGYKSPAFSGLTTNIAVGLGEGSTARQTGFNVEYAAGPIYAAIGYEKLTKGPVPAFDGNSLVNLAFQYDFGMVKPMLYYARAKVSNGVTGGALTNKYFNIGALAPIGGGTLKVAYGRFTPDSNAAGAGVVAAYRLATGKESGFGIGYDYPLSKRTNVYLDAGSRRKADNDNRVGVGTGAAYTNNTIIGLGVNHTF